MKTKLFLCLMGLIVLASGCSRKPNVPAEVTSHDKKATFWVPNEGKWEKQDVPSQAGTLTTHIYASEYGPNKAIVFSYFERPRGSFSFSYERAREGCLREIKGKLIDSKMVRVPGGREYNEFSFSGKNGWQSVAGTARIYFINGQLYQVLAINGGTKPEKNDEVKKFMDSFKHKDFRQNDHSETKEEGDSRAESGKQPSRG